MTAALFSTWFDDLGGIGRSADGGWRRFAWTREDRAARDWFRAVAASLEMPVEQDRNGNLWAWWEGTGEGAVATGSHLDTVAGGGAYDGALGVIGGFAAVAELRRRRPGPPPRPVAVVAFADEEGGRFDLPCFGSRLTTGALDPARVLDRPDASGTRLREALAGAGVDPDALGPDPERLRDLAAFVELHIEQGRALAEEDLPLGVGTAIWPHGRWHLELAGEANHAGTTRLDDRHDPLLVLAGAVEVARAGAAQDAMVATVGRVVVEPNAPNSIPARVEAILDARAPDEGTLDRFVDRWTSAVTDRAGEGGVGCTVTCQARAPGVELDRGLRDVIVSRLRDAGIGAMPLATAAGHDAGTLSTAVPAAMLFVRNPTGASHTPAEAATLDDCLTGVEALVAVLEDLVW